jgi:nucleotide-binding universal stress UspA family protein
MSTATERAPLDAAALSTFARVVAGVDGSDAGYEAVRQAARLVAADGWLELFTAVYLVEANRAAWSAPRIRAKLEREAARAVCLAAAIAGPRARSRLVSGPPTRSLMRELEEKQATLAVVGTHGHSRLSEIMIGGVAGEVLHSAPCSVCIVRRSAAEALFPRAIVVGCDTSAESELAVAVGRHLADRFSASLSIVTALGGKDVDRERARELGAVVVGRHPVEALVSASEDADLVVVGSRGLHGIKALGSVSERVAHQANCSVMVLRGGD